jgi:hypothetical protein
MMRSPGRATSTRGGAGGSPMRSTAVVDLEGPGAPYYIEAEAEEGGCPFADEDPPPVGAREVCLGAGFGAEAAVPGGDR